MEKNRKCLQKDWEDERRVVYIARTASDRFVLVDLPFDYQANLQCFCMRPPTTGQRKE